jgi:hypothetical protein
VDKKIKDKKQRVLEGSSFASEVQRGGDWSISVWKPANSRTNYTWRLPPTAADALSQAQTIAVGTPITGCPPHRTVRAGFPHKMWRATFDA